MTFGSLAEWTKDDSPIDFSQSPRVQINFWDSSLIISAALPLDTGRYTCIASNGVDSASVNALLVVQGVPGSPLNVMVDCSRYISEMWALVSWDPGTDNYAPILTYRIEFNTSFSPDKYYTAVISNDSNLNQSSRYAKVKMVAYASMTFRVYARNIVGLSDPSTPSYNVCRTDPQPPTTNPRYVIVRGTMPNNVVVYWTVRVYTCHSLFWILFFIVQAHFLYTVQVLFEYCTYSVH